MAPLLILFWLMQPATLTKSWDECFTTLILARVWSRLLHGLESSIPSANSLLPTKLRPRLTRDPKLKETRNCTWRKVSRET